MRIALASSSDRREIDGTSTFSPLTILSLALANGVTATPDRARSMIAFQIGAAMLAPKTTR
jgi:hypothetical protein